MCDLPRREGDLGLRGLRAQVHLQGLCSEAEGEDAGLIGRLREEERSEEGGLRPRAVPPRPR